ncbi:MAG: AAA family ATPase, partial [Desulfobulbaceae bacterium]|nr:AAA family ATPase [Desulfobulbaceae bacterium]
MSETIQESLECHLKKLRLATIQSHYPEFTEIAIEQQQRYDEYLLALMEKESEVR